MNDSGMRAAGGAAERRDEDEEDAAEDSPFFGIDKGAVLQEARVFHDQHLDARKCQHVITKLLYLIMQGESLTSTEATNVFFAVTKLFQSSDANLRRMVYLCIKDISPGAEEVIIVTSSLMKDMTSKSDLYRANAIRVLCRITDSSLLQQVERYLKQAVVDKSPAVASSALSSGLQLAQHSSSIVKRWLSEIQEACESKSAMVQFHAIALLHHLKSGDRLAVSKLVSQLTKGHTKSNLASCLVVRYAAECLSDAASSQQRSSQSGKSQLWEFMESSLKSRSEQVSLEAARSMASISGVSGQDLRPAISRLRSFLSSSLPITRFAAIRTLNRIADMCPVEVSAAQYDLENLIGDSNKSIATLAVTTQLQIGEGSVDRLMKQAAGLLSELHDELKVVVVDAIEGMCIKYPHKHSNLMGHLASILREEGGYEFKRAVVETLLKIMRNIPESTEAGLSQLAEFIEDCEHTHLSTRVLHVLGEEGPSADNPRRLIRPIYNRVVLEAAPVRAAAISALAKFGAKCDSLSDQIGVLLRRCLHDNDDEVRDRATFALAALEASNMDSKETGIKLLSGNLPAYDLAALEERLTEYVNSTSEEAFDISTTPLEAEKKKSISPETSGLMPPKGKDADKGEGDVKEAEQEERTRRAEAVFEAVSELKQLGTPFKTTEPVALTEEETEYKVKCMKHMLTESIVLQFDCINTVPEQVLSQVSVAVDGENANLEEERTIELETMPLNEVGSTFTCMRKKSEEIVIGQVQCNLKFRAREIDPATNEPEALGHEDEYQLESVEINARDSSKELPLPLGKFEPEWSEKGEESEVIEEYALGRRDDLQTAIDDISNAIGFHVCDNSQLVDEHARSHALFLSGEILGSGRALAIVRVGMDAHGEVAMQLTSRGDAANAVHELVQ